MLGVLAGEGLIDGKTVGVESGAAMRSIVRRDTGEAYNGLAKRHRDTDANRAGATRPQAVEERIEQRVGAVHEDEGRTNALAHKVEHAADMKTGAILAVRCSADQGDTTTSKKR